MHQHSGSLSQVTGQTVYSKTALCSLQTQGPHPSPPQSHSTLPKPNKHTNCFRVFLGLIFSMGGFFFCSYFISNTEKIPQDSVRAPHSLPSLHSKPISRIALFLKEQFTLNPQLALQNQRNCVYCDEHNSFFLTPGH